MINLKITKMKKLFSLVCLVVLLGVSVNVMGQGTQQISGANVFRNYWVNSADGTTAPGASHLGSTYQWNVYDWDGTVDYSVKGGTWDLAKTATTNTKFTFDAVNVATVFNPKIKWNNAGKYVLEAVETSSTNCVTIRRFGVVILDIDLLVVTENHLNVTLADVATYCNTDENSVFGDADDDNLNSTTGVTPALGTMVYTYSITLFTEKNTTDDTKEIGDVTLPAAQGGGAPQWRFTLDNNSILPSNPTEADITWAVVDGTPASITTNSGTTVITAGAGISTVTVTATVQNIAAAAIDQYELDFAIDPATVQLDLSGSVTPDFSDGQEDATYNAAGANRNAPYKVTINSIPNISKIKFN